jgi:hypothetical protein
VPRTTAAAEPGWKVRRDVGHIRELVRERHEPVHIGEVGRDAQRDADRAARRHPDEPEVVVEDRALLEALRKEPLLRDRERDLAGTGVAEAPRPEGDVVLRRDTVDKAFVDHAPVRVQEVERDRAPAAVPRRRPVDADRGAAVGVLQPLHRLEQPTAQARDSLRDRVDTDPLEVA